MFRNASSAHKEDMRGETMLLELRRVYHCAAYNCMISIISCTQTELKFYTGLLFSDSPTKVCVFVVFWTDFNIYDPLPASIACNSSSVLYPSRKNPKKVTKEKRVFVRSVFKM